MDGDNTKKHELASLFLHLIWEMLGMFHQVDFIVWLRSLYLLLEPYWYYETLILNFSGVLATQALVLNYKLLCHLCIVIIGIRLKICTNAESATCVWFGVKGGALMSCFVDLVVVVSDVDLPSFGLHFCFDYLWPLPAPEEVVAGWACK